MILNVNLYLCSFTPSIGALTNGTNSRPHLVLAQPLPSRRTGTQPRWWSKSLPNQFQVRSFLTLPRFPKNCPKNSLFSFQFLTSVLCRLDRSLYSALRPKQPNLDGNSISFSPLAFLTAAKDAPLLSYLAPTVFIQEIAPYSKT